MKLNCNACYWWDYGGAQPTQVSRPTIRQASLVLNFDAPLPTLPDRVPNSLSYFQQPATGPNGSIIYSQSNTESSMATTSSSVHSTLEALWKAGEDQVPNLVLYNYPSFSGAFSALFAHLFHTRLNLRCLILPFSSVEPFRTDDIPIERIEKCYLLDCIGPDGFAAELSRRSTSEIICFDHRKSGLSRIKPFDKCPKNLTFHVDVEKSSSSAAFDYFSMKLSDMRPSDGESVSLLSMKDRERIESVLKYIEDGDLPQLLEISHFQLISKGNLQISSTKKAAKEFLRNVFRIRLGRGLYGECLGVRADGNSNLSDEIGKMLSIKSAAAGLRPIGAVIYMQRQNLKMCLRSTDARIDTSEVAKAYGGGGNHSSSSFMIRMDEYNKWRNESDR
ncbi:unnamed protein product [Rhodiola kirilowii]